MLHSRRFNTRVNCSSLLFFFFIAFLVKRGLVLLSLQFVFVLSISHFFTTFFSFLLFFFFTSFLSYVTRQHGVMRVLRAQGKVLSVFRFFFLDATSDLSINRTAHAEGPIRRKKKEGEAVHLKRFCSAAPKRKTACFCFCFGVRIYMDSYLFKY